MGLDYGRRNHFRDGCDRGDLGETVKIFIWTCFGLSSAGVALRILCFAILDYPRTLKYTRADDAWRLAWALATAVWTLLLLARN